MARKRMMRDLIVLVPGIMGSILAHKGVNLWETAYLLGPAVLRQTDYFERLRLENDDGDPDRTPGGLQPTQLMNGVHGIHGLKLGEGYRQIRARITDYFIVTHGTPDTEAPINFLTFPYDWRRDNRITARRLAQVVAQKLNAWQRHTYNPDAKVILIGHSMGGLVSRYYLDVLGGWQSCRALITYGTPHRGSVQALESICDRHMLGRTNLTELIRTFPSVYQLLPIYPVIQRPTGPQRLSDIPQLPGLNDVHMQLVADGLAFHEEIKQAASQYGTDYPYPIIPIVGAFQPTAQSALIEHDGIHLSHNLPFELPEGREAVWLAGGDGTVPYLSAVPIQPPRVQRKTRYSETHAWLPNNPQALTDLCHELDEMQLEDYLKNYQGGSYSETTDLPAAIQLSMAHLYEEGETITVRAAIANTITSFGNLTLTLQPANGGDATVRDFTKGEDGWWQCRLEDVERGIYTVEVQTSNQGPHAPPAIHDILEVTHTS